MAAITMHIVIKEMAAEPRPRINFVMLVFSISASLVSGCIKSLGCHLADPELFTSKKEKDRYV